MGSQAGIKGPADACSSVKSAGEDSKPARCARASRPCCCFLCFKTIYQPPVQAYAAAAPGLLQKLGRVLREKAQGDLDRIRSGTSKTRERLGVGHMSASSSACLASSAASCQADHLRRPQWALCQQTCCSHIDVTGALFANSRRRHQLDHTFLEPLACWQSHCGRAFSRLPLGFTTDSHPHAGCGGTVCLLEVRGRG